MSTNNYIDGIRAKIAENEIDKALQQLRLLLENSPKLHEVIVQSSCFKDICKQICPCKVSNAEANLTQDQIKAGIEELLTEISSQNEFPELQEDIKQAILKNQYKNLIVNSPISAGGSIKIGDQNTTLNGNSNIVIQGDNNIIHPPPKEKSAKEFYLDGTSSFNREIAKEINNELPNFEKALQYFNEATAREAGYLDAILAKAHTLMKIGDFELAIKNFKEALKFKPHNYDAMYNIAVSYIKQGDPERAFNWLERAINEFDCNEQDNGKVFALLEIVESRKKQS